MICFLLWMRVFELLFSSDLHTTIALIRNYFKKHEITTKNVSRYELRIQTIKTEMPKKEKYRQYFGYIFSKISHIIPNEITNISDNVKYKRELKGWLITNESLKRYIDQYKT